MGSDIIEAAGGVSAAARDGIDGFKSISVELILAMNPNFTLIPQDGEGAVKLREDLLADPVLATVPAVVNERVYLVHPPNYIVLSHWTVQEGERTAQLLYPDRFADVTFADFAPYDEDSAMAAIAGNPAIAARDLSVSLGGAPVLKSVSFAARAGEVAV